MDHPNKDPFEILEHFPPKKTKSNLLSFKVKKKKDNNDEHIDVYPSY